MSKLTTSGSNTVGATLKEGLAVGTSVGEAVVGLPLGEPVGLTEGLSVGEAVVGLPVGCSVHGIIEVSRCMLKLDGS